jgi:hypothetical protein
MLLSYALMIPGVSRRFGPGVGAISSGVRLLPRMASFEKLVNACPWKLLPPDRGTMLSTGPPMSTSPMPPAIVNAISSTLTVS